MSNQVKTNVEQSFNTPEGKEWLLGVLHDDVVKNLRITFTKKDGTEREMPCTLIESQIPEDKRPKTQSTQTSQDPGSAVRVFDTGINEWRSFRWDSIKRVEFSIGE